MDLERFVHAQEHSYERALSEIKGGQKRSHWMWYIFPQLEGLGHSAMSQRYSIGSLAEAEMYLKHPILASPGESIFQELFRKYFHGENDPATLRLLKSAR